MKTHAVVAASLLAMLAAVVVPSPAGAAPLLCRKKKRVIVRDDQCKGKKETELLDAGEIAALTGIQEDLSAIRRFGFVKLSDGQTQELLSVGPLTLTARCRINVGGNDIADILVGTSQNGAVFDGDDKSTDLTMATDAANRQYAEVSAPTGSPSLDGLDGIAAAPDGTAFAGTHFVGLNVLNSPGQCVFGGFVVLLGP